MQTIYIFVGRSSNSQVKYERKTGYETDSDLSFELSFFSRYPVCEIILKPIVENRQKLQKLLQLLTRMEKALQQWETMIDGTADGYSVCHLIDGIDDTTQTNNQDAFNIYYSLINHSGAPFC